MFTPSVVLLLLVSTITQVAGALLIPATKGLTAPLLMIGMFLGESASPLKILLLVSACGLVLTASHMR